MDAEFFINRLLDRIEINAGYSNKAWRKEAETRQELKRHREALDIAQAANRRHYSEMKAATDKITEWQEYAEKLRALLLKHPPKKGGRIVLLPLPPEPFTLPIPF